MSLLTYEEIVDEMSLAVLASIEYLKQQGDSQIIVRNGQLVSSQGEIFLYEFTSDKLQLIEEDADVEVRIGAVPERLLRHADEIWQTSSTREVLAITTLDGAPVGDGRPGLLGQRMLEWYQAFKTAVMRADYT